LFSNCKQHWNILKKFTKSLQNLIPWKLVQPFSIYNTQIEGQRDMGDLMGEFMQIFVAIETVTVIITRNYRCTETAPVMRLAYQWDWPSNILALRQAAKLLERETAVTEAAIMKGVAASVRAPLPKISER
jgi:hypothetical protein